MGFTVFYSRFITAPRSNLSTRKSSDTGAAPPKLKAKQSRHENSRRAVVQAMGCGGSTPADDGGANSGGTESIDMSAEKKKRKSMTVRRAAVR
jgi:hypothetical protein